MGCSRFILSKQGLHYVDVSVEGETVQQMVVTANMSDEEEDDFKEMEEVENTNKDKSPNKEFVMVNTVQGTLEGYTKQDIEKAQEAR
jgi:hypothetical protein